MDAFELWCWRRLLRVPWTARRSNQSILKEISPKCSLEGLMLNLKFQYFGHLMRSFDSFQKTLMLGKIEGRRRRGRQRRDGSMASPTRCTWVRVNSGSRRWTGRPGVLWFMWSQRVRHNWATELNWTEMMFHFEVSSQSPTSTWKFKNTPHEAARIISSFPWHSICFLVFCWFWPWCTVVGS